MSPRLGDFFDPVDRSWWDAMSDESRVAYRTYLKRPLCVRVEVLSDTILTGVEAVMAMGSPVVEGWFLEQEPEDYPAREGL